MAVNAYLEINGRPGPSTSKPDAIDTLSTSFGATQTSTPPATVQVGEQTLGQVADRLGIDKDQLLQANPHIKDPSDLKVGQEIQLPTQTAPRSQSSAATEPAGTHHHHHHHQELPNAPLGSSIEASLTKAKLDGMATKQGED